MDKIYELEKVKTKLKSLPFDSIIRGKFLGGIYTHWDVEGKPMFLMQELKGDTWVTLNYYCVGVKSFIQRVIDHDFKITTTKQFILRIKFKGIDDWDRPVYKVVDPINNKNIYYGSVTTLFNGDNATEEIVNAYFKNNMDELEYFGTSFNCEPHGGRHENHKLVIA